jgi:hypothetical protein
VAQEYSEDRLVFRLSSDDAVELDQLGEGFGGLARNFKRYLEGERVDPKEVSSKLFVTELKTGSVEFEVAALASLYTYASSSANGYLVWTQFYDRVRENLEYLAGRIPRPAKYTQEDASDFDSFLKAISGKRGAHLNVRRAKFHKKDGAREILSEFDFNEKDVANANFTLQSDLDNFGSYNVVEPPSKTKTERNVPFIWFRTDREKGKAIGQTSDRGIVAKISDKPLPVFFASEIDNFKDQMNKTKSNPFDLVYLVDVGVELSETGDPRSYTILNIHRTVGD